MKKRSELLFSVLQIPIDYLMLVAAFVLAFLLREGSGKPFYIETTGHTYLSIMLIVLPIWLVIFGAVGLYKLIAVRSMWVDFGQIIAACAAGVMILVVIDFLSPTSIFPAKSIPIYGFVLSILLVSLARLLVDIIQKLLALKGVGVYRVLFIGSGKPAVELKSVLAEQKHTYRVVHTIASLSQVSMEKLKQILDAEKLDAVIVADTSAQESKLVTVLNFCQQYHVNYRFAPTLTGLYTSKINSTHIGSIPILELQPTPLDGWGRIVKRLFDVVITTVLMIISLPIQVIIYLIIKISDPGPALYMHECYGRDGKKISVYKFRTMRSKYSLGPKFGGRTIEDVLAQLTPEQAAEFRRTAKIKNDPRVSPFGRFLRKTSLDELPQLFNVLAGDLSLVGPRPLPESELELVGGEEVLAKILTIRPGITGLWQVSGRNDIEYSERTKLNLFYLENWSIWLDFSILFKTIWQVIYKRNGR